MKYHVFISYARKDNLPRGTNGKGWIEIFKAQLEAQHRQATGRDLKVFLDVTDITNGEEWETRLQMELRQSRIFIAILSPNYLASPICRMELEDYIRHEQVVAPGGNGVRPIYFATIPEFELDARPDDDWAWLIKDLQRRNRDLGLDWCNWTKGGLDALLRLDVEDRLAELSANPLPPLDQFARGIKTLSAAIGARLNDCALAALAAGHGNLAASHVNFVGRSREMAEIHRNLINNQAQVVTALHGLGGLGKSALARQYAHAYASHYAGGGRWEVGCEGLGKGLDNTAGSDPLALLSLAIGRLVDAILLRDPGDEPRYSYLRPVPEDQTLSTSDRLSKTLTRLRAFTVGGWDVRLAALRREVGDGGEDHGPWPANHPPRMLVILDNVDSPDLLNAKAYAALQSPDWLELIVTTRLDPTEVGDPSGMKVLAVEFLSSQDAVALIRTMLRRSGNRAALSPEDNDALNGIVTSLGGFTLAVELAGAFLSVYPKVSIAGYLRRLTADGIASVDTATTEGSKSASVAGILRHNSGQVGVIVDQMLADLPVVVVDLLHLASHFGPDHVNSHWLRILGQVTHPDLGETRDGYEAPWDAIVNQFTGRRLLTESGSPGVWRLHRLVRAHLRRLATPERLRRDRELVIELTEMIAYRMEDVNDEGDGWFDRPEMWQNIWPVFDALSNTLIADGPVHHVLVNALSIRFQREHELGSSESAFLLLNRHLEISQEICRLNPESADAQRGLSIAQSHAGDYYLRRGAKGDQERAHLAYRSALDLRTEIAKAPPDAEVARRDLWTAQIQIGDFYLRRGAVGDPERSRQAFENAQNCLTKQSPKSTSDWRDQAVTYERLGDFYQRHCDEGSIERAFLNYDGALKVREKLMEERPASTEARRDVAVSQQKVGTFYLSRGSPGDEHRALQAYTIALEICKDLTVENSESAQAWGDLFVSYLKIGKLFLGTDGAVEANYAFEAVESSLNIANQLVMRNPNDAEAKRCVSVSLYTLGQIASRRGKDAEACEYFAKALEILESFVAEGQLMDPVMQSVLAELRQVFQQ
jgi:tetratricopeptide (TPR) repeat protein